MKKLFVLIILTASLLTVSTSTVMAVSNAGALFLRVAPGARAGGMGEAFVAIADDATATYWNPAGLGNAPIAGTLKSFDLPDDLDNLKAVTEVLDSDDNPVVWGIAGDELVRFNGHVWVVGENYQTSSDQTLYDFLRRIISVDSDDELKPMAESVIAANISLKRSEVEAFVERVKENVPDDYKDMDELTKGLDAILTGYDGCLLNPQRFAELQKKLKDGLKDGTMTSEEIDRITFSLTGTVNRFLASQLTVPYSASVNGKLQCIAGAGKYLWVGSDNGLYRLSGRTWARYSSLDGLPSDNILILAASGDNLMIGTDSGIASYNRGNFSDISPRIYTTTEEDLMQASPTDSITPEFQLIHEPVTALTYKGPTKAFAVVGGSLYSFDGVGWVDYYDYTVRLNDDLAALVERCSIYGIESERAYLERKILDLNSDQDGNGPAGDWLTEGHVVKLPLSPQFRYKVNDMFVDAKSDLWVGTGSGLLSFNGKAWTIYGYEKFTIPAVDDTVSEPRPYTAEDIARVFLTGGDSAKVAILAENIDEYNELDGNPVEPGQSVYVYTENIGAEIYSIGDIYGVLHVGTEHGLEAYTESGWEPVTIENLDHKVVLSTFDHKGESFYAYDDGVVTGTRGRKEFTFMHVNWLPALNLDMYYDFLSYVQNIRGMGTLGIQAVYLNYGQIQFTDAQGNPTDEEVAYEMAIAASYGTSINSKIKAGITGRFIHSRLSSQGTGQERGNGIASTFSVDLGMLAKLTDRWNLGVVVSNLGPNITYVDASQSDPLPRNLAVGMAYKLWETPYNKLTIQGELNKILVQLDGGFSRELEEATRHIGMEYWYSHFLALRGGYKYDKEGQLRHFTFGAGIQLSAFRLDFAYVPSSEDSPLSNTLRVSLTGTF